MTTPRGDVTAAVAGLQARWGTAAPRVLGTLAIAPAPDLAPAPEPAEHDAPALAPRPGERIVRTGFPALDAILGPGGLPTSASVAIRGDGSSGRTTLALRTVAEAQAGGSVVAWVDLSRSFDPVEAVARGVRLEWLVVITPASLDEGLSIAGSLLTGRSVDVLVLDLPGGRLARTDTPARVADRLHRLAALARRAETLLLVLDAPGRGGGLATAVDQATSIRLELVRRSWIRLGRDIVGQRTEALVAHDRHGRSGRTATLRILYAEGGERDACLARDGLLVDAVVPARDDPEPGVRRMHAPEPGVRRMHAPEPGVRRMHAPDLDVAPAVEPVHSTHTTSTHHPDHVGPVHQMHVSVLYQGPELRSPAGTCVRCTTTGSEGEASASVPLPIHAPTQEAPDRESDHATPARLRAAPLPGLGGGPPLRALPDRAARAGRPAVGPGSGHRCQPGRAGPRRPARDAARERPSTRP